MLESRAYNDDDLPALQEALARWRTEAGLSGYCHVGDLPHRIYTELSGAHPVGELVRVWADSDGVAGFAICGRFGTSFDVFVRPEWRGGAAELAMLRTAYDVTKHVMVAASKGNTWAISDVFGDDDVRARQLEELGFERYRVWDHVTTRELTDLPDAALPEGFTLRHAEYADADRLAAVRNESFDEAWSGEQLHDQVLTKPGYRPERELVAVAPDGRFAAYTVTWLDPVNLVGHFEPVGTSSAFRRLGVARALMCHGLAELQRAGMRTATVSHDATNAAARALYTGLGFVQTYETHGYRRAE